MSDIYSDSIYPQIKSPCKKRFPSPLTYRLVCKHWRHAREAETELLYSWCLWNYNE